MIRCPNTLHALEAGSVPFRTGPFRAHRFDTGRQGSLSGAFGDPGSDLAVYGPSHGLCAGVSEYRAGAVAHSLGERAPATSAPMTPELRQRIRAYHGRHPEVSSQAIATLFNVNPGRVSEALAEW